VVCGVKKACDDSWVYALERTLDKNLVGKLPSWNGDSGQGAFSPYIKYLLLTDNPGLTGSIPATFSTMSNLKTLALSNNSLDGPLPEAWGEMRMMVNIDLKNNHLQGPLPDAWETMRVIETLSLGNNRFNGSLPNAWRQMTRMQRLELNHNNLEGTLPAIWSIMTGMDVINLSNNRLRGTLPLAWGNMDPQTLWASSNNIDGTFPETWSVMMTSMIQLRLNNNRIVGTLPPSFSAWAQLATFDLSSNRLVGTLPPQWATLSSPLFSVLSLRNNSLSGTLPSEWSRLHNLSQLYLDNNKFAGTIPSSWGGETDGPLPTQVNQPNFQVVTMQHNSLTGIIPRGLANGDNMCILLLNDNRLRGRLPPLSPGLFRPNCTIYSGKQFSSQFRPAILVYNNRLSCSMPGAPLVTGPSRYYGLNTCGIHNPYCGVPAPEFNFPDGTCDVPVTASEGVFLKPAFNTNSLFLLGNRFSTTAATGIARSIGDTAGGIQIDQLPRWMENETHGDPMTKGARFLYLHTGGFDHVLSSFTKPTAYFFGGALILALVTHGLVWRAQSCTLEINNNCAPLPLFDDSVSMHDRTAQLHGLLIRNMAYWSGPLVLVMVPLYVTGAHYYECGDALVKTSSAYLADAVGIEGLAAVALVVVASTSAVFAAWFRVVFCARNMERRLQQQEQHHVHQQGGNRPAAVSNGDAGPAPPSGNPFLLFLLWVAVLALLSFPSFVYGMIAAVPTQDSIFGESFAVIAEIIHGGAPIIITIVNSLAVPAVVMYCCNRSKWQSAHLLLVSRLVTTWLVPVTVEVLFSNSCGRLWLRLWVKCKLERRHEMDVWGPSGDAIVVPGSMCYVGTPNTQVGGDNLTGSTTGYTPNGFIQRVVLVSGENICNPSARNGGRQYAQCGRAVVEAMAPLLVGKMALAAFWLPALTIFRWRVAPAGWKRFVCGLVGRCRRFKRAAATTTTGENQNGLIAPEEGDDDGNRDRDANGNCPQKKSGLRLDNVVAQSLTWLDVAIVFGPHIPLLVPLVLVSLVTTRWAHESVGLRRMGLRETRAEFSAPSTWYVLFSVVCQQVLTAAVFVGVGDSSGSGSGVFMMVIGVLVTILCLFVAAVPVRVLEAVGLRVGGYCSSCCARFPARQWVYQQWGRVEERTAAMRQTRRGSLTELTGGSWLGVGDGGEGTDDAEDREGNHVLVYDDARNGSGESKAPTLGTIGSTLETPLLQG
jgi:hypothetical protein